MEIIPEIYQGLPVVKYWKDIGANSKMFKLSNVVKFENFRLLKVPNGYVALCSIDPCRGLIKSNGLCINHIKGIKTYRFCGFKDCENPPTYGYEEKKPLFCINNKELDMIHVKCGNPNCNKRPNFGHTGCKAIFCFEHKEDGMVGVRN